MGLDWAIQLSAAVGLIRNILPERSQFQDLDPTYVFDHFFWNHSTNRRKNKDLSTGNVFLDLWSCFRATA